MNKSSYNYNAKRVQNPLAAHSSIKGERKKVLTLVKEHKYSRVKLTYEFIRNVMNFKDNQTTDSRKKYTNKRGK